MLKRNAVGASCGSTLFTDHQMSTTHSLYRYAGLVLLFSCFVHPVCVVQAQVGWRTDGSGCYPDAKPPIEWSPEKNVVWKTQLPGRSFASPIIVGDRIFVVSEPAELLCIRAKDGKILWQRSNSPAEALGSKKAERIADDWKKINEQRRQLQKQFRELQKSNPNAKTKLDHLRKQTYVIEAKMSEMRRGSPVPGNSGAGDTAGTPVSDGKLVYTVYGNGIVSAYDLDGERRWIRFVEGSAIGFGHASSPLLVERKLILHFHDLVALDADNGKMIWGTEAPARHASPIATRINDVDVVISPSGNIVRISDGKILLTHPALQSSECSPIIDNGKVYTQADKTSAFQLPAAVGNETTLKLLWQSKTAGGRRTPSPVLHNGLLYGVTTSGILDVIEAASGESVYRERIDIGNVYSSPTIAGSRLYISSTRGNTIVLELGRKYKVVARNKLESFGSCPVFAGERMFVRCSIHLYCIGK